jgi:hypothetical protein
MSTPTADPIHQRLLSRLRDGRPDGPLASLVQMGLDHVLSRRVSELVERQALLTVILKAAGGPALEATLQRHIKPGIERALASAKAHDERFGVWLPESVQLSVSSLLGEPMSLDADEVRTAVKGDAIRQMLSTVVQEAITRFMKSGELPGGGGGGVVGLFGKGAGMLRDAGKGLLGSFGDELERQVQKRIRDVLDLSMAPLQDRLVEWLLSPDTAKALGRGRARMFRDFQKRRTAPAISQLPIDQLLTLVPPIVRHNLARPELQAAVLAEIDAWLAQEGNKTVRELLEEAGILDEIKADLGKRALEQAQGLVQTDGFAAWLHALTEEP